MTDTFRLPNIRAALVAFLAAVLLLPVLVPAPAAAAVTLDAEEAAFCTLINNYRASKGLAPLQVSPMLTAASDWYSTDMATKNYVNADHTDSLGRTIKERIEDFGYTFNTYWGENIAWGYATANQNFQAWKNSSTHNRNMLNPNFTVIGIGRAVDTSSRYDHYWTTDFGGFADAGTVPCPGGTTPPPDQPAVSVLDVATVEGNSSTGATKLMKFKVKLPKVAKAPVTVTYATSDGTATAGSDYQARTGQATIATGTRVAIVSIPIVKDKVREPNETLQLTISNPVNAVLGDASGTGTITNDD